MHRGWVAIAIAGLLVASDSSPVTAPEPSNPVFVLDALPPDHPATNPEMDKAAQDLLSARRANAKRQREGDPAAVWMFVKP